MDETYASNVANLNERLREYKQGEVDKASSLIESATNKYNTQLSEYQDKWKAVQDGGQDEVAAQMGVKGVYNGVKNVYEIYKKYKGKDAEDEDEEDDGTAGGSEGDPTGAKLDGENPAPLSEEDKAFLQDPMKDMKAVRASTQERMNSRLKELGLGDDDTSAPSASGSAAQAPADTQVGTSDADISQARATAEGADTDLGKLGEATEESAFGDLSQIPDTAWGRLDLRLRAERATARGGNIRSGKGASDATQSSNPATSEGQPASGQATEGGNSVPAEQSSSGYRPEGSQSRTLDQNAGTEDITGQPKAPASGGGGGSAADEDLNPLDSDLPDALPEAGGFFADLATTEAATAAIPVVGEAAAFVGGLVAIGEGIYHLFHPPAKKAAVAPVMGSGIPQSVQAKYAQALPSFDSSSDNMSSDAVF